MSTKQLNTRIQLKHDFEENWEKAGNSDNPFIPKSGEVIIYDAEIDDTGNALTIDNKTSTKQIEKRPRIKVGDGVTNVNNLKFSTGLALENGSSDSSVQQIGNIAGTKGYYYKHIYYKTDDKGVMTSGEIYLTTTKSTEYPTISTESKGTPDETFETPAYSKGDRLCLVNGSKYEYGALSTAQVDSVSNNVITYTGDIGFTTISEIAAENRNIDDYTLFTIDHPTVGDVVVREGTFATGHNSQALGLYSVAFGQDTLAIGNFSSAVGRGTTAYYSAHAEGYETNAIGSGSHSEGRQTIASGTHSHAEGRFSTAEGTNSHAEGVHTTAQGTASHAEGSGTIAKAVAHAEGSGTRAYGDGSHAEGTCTTSYAEQSHAEGFATQTGDPSDPTLGKAAHAEGFATKAVGTASHAEGEGKFTYVSITLVDPTGSDAFTYEFVKGTINNDSIGNKIRRGSIEASIIGVDTTKKTITVDVPLTHVYESKYRTENLVMIEKYLTAKGQCSHAEGYATEAHGNQTHVEGSYTVATVHNQHVQGTYNYLDASGSSGNYAHVVGNGTASKRSNAHTLDWDGNGWYAGGVFVGGSSKDEGKKLATEDYVGTHVAAYVANKNFATVDYVNSKAGSTVLIGTAEELTGEYSEGTLLIDISETDGGLKYYNGSEWVTVPVRFS